MLHLILFLAATTDMRVDVPPTPEVTKTYKDWTVGCDNLRFCSAMSLEMTGNQGAQVPIHIFRGGHPAEAPTIRIDVSMFEELRLSVGSELLPEREPNAEGKIQFCGDEALKLIRMLAEAEKMVAQDPDDHATASQRHSSIGRTSLVGLKAALLYMDDQQGRVDTSTALIRTGTKAVANNAPGYAVSLRRPATPKTPPRKMSADALQQTYSKYGCDAEEIAQTLPPISVRLDAENSLYIIHLPCNGGAYNLIADARIVDEAGFSRPARFDIGAGMTGDEVENFLVNAEWIAPLRTLRSFELGRGLGDCGRRRSFVWDGEMFRLARQEEMNECRGAMGFIATYNASVFDLRE